MQCLRGVLFAARRVHACTPLPPLTSRAPAPRRRSYGYLVLVWGATLAHHYDSLLEEAGRILPVRAAPVSLGRGGSTERLMLDGGRPHQRGPWCCRACSLPPRFLARTCLQVAATTFGLDAPAWLPQLTMQPEVSHAMQVPMQGVG